MAQPHECVAQLILIVSCDIASFYVIKTKCMQIYSSPMMKNSYKKAKKNTTVVNGADQCSISMSDVSLVLYQLAITTKTATLP